MALSHSPSTVTNGLVLCLDAANVKSYPGTGNTWSDISGNNRNATLSGSVSYSSQFNGTLDFSRPSGNQGLATIPHDSVISQQVFGSSTNFALSAWVNARSFNNYGTLIQKAFGGSYSNTTVGIWVESPLRLRLVVGSNVNSNPTGSTSSVLYTAEINTWYNVVCIGDGTSATMYINGISVGSVLFSSVTVTRTENTSPITIGSRSTGSAPELDALVGPIAVYNRALTAAEIQQNFNALRGRYGI